MKNEIRKRILERRNTLSAYEVLEKSNRIISKLEEQTEFRDADIISCYISFDNEVYTHGLIKKYCGIKKIAVPYIRHGEIALSYVHNWNELRAGTYGILEPSVIEEADEMDIELAIVPGVAFDEHGNRIGYGKGYFDRLLKKMKAIKIALAFELQIVDEIEYEEHDVRMDKIITEERIISFS